MNRYLLVDFENLEAFSLNKVSIDFDENLEQTCSTTYENIIQLYEELIKELEEEKEHLKEQNN